MKSYVCKTKFRSSGGALDAGADLAVGTPSARTKNNVASQNAVIRPILLFTAVANTTGAAGAASGAGHTLV